MSAILLRFKSAQKTSMNAFIVSVKLHLANKQTNGHNRHDAVSVCLSVKQSAQLK